MPASETPSNPRLPEDEGGAPVAVADAEDASPNSASPEPPTRSGYSTSRYIDYDTHELLEKIAEYEDERRWQRIREGIWISILLHFVIFSGLTWIPRYVFHRPQLIDPFQALKNKENAIRLTDLNDARKEIEKLKKAPAPKPEIDKKTLDQLKAMEKARPKPTPPAPEVKQQAPPAPVETPKLPEPAAQPTPPAVSAPQPAQQIPQEAPRPAPVPARPNFSLGSQNPEDQLRSAMRNSRGGSGSMSGPGLAQHHGADGGVQVLSDTQGVDFGPYLQKVIRETYRTWDPLIPEEVNPPIYKKGQVEIVFTILPNGRLQPHAMILTGRSGDVALDRAAWGAIEGADYPQLPSEFHGPYLQLRFRFEYNMR
ncbi:MAG TPA: hypothetical protein VL346_00465 [Acidobacteriaceae bacterium]|nr:hypothetical protein [Acidobacteriaceae bacterium]